MTKTEAMIRAIEQDLPHFHRERMNKLQSEQMQQLLAEQEKARPDPARIKALKAAMVQTERDKRDISITEREVLVPLREKLAREQV